MKQIIIIVITCLVQQIIVAQQITLSDPPTSKEIKAAFISAGSGEIDLFEIMPKVISKGDKVVTALQDMVFATVGEDQKPEEVKRTAIYAVMALEGISTNQAFTILLNTVATHRDPEVRGQALKAITQSYYQKTIEKKDVPDKEILHLLLINADNNTQSEYLHKSIAKIAREGLRTWANLDLGDVVKPEQIDPSEEPAQKIHKLAGREKWWQDNNEKIKWSKDLGRFKIK